MTEDTNRIIGDFLEINSDIIAKQAMSKLPKFISNIVYGRYKKRLIKSVKKLKNSNIVLSRDNLFEFFLYCYNNFPPNGSYKSISKVLHNETKTEAVIKFESIQAIIELEKYYDGFNVSVKEKMIDSGEYQNFSIHCVNMESRLKKLNDTVAVINKQLVSDISEFILDNISI